MSGAIRPETDGRYMSQLAIPQMAKMGTAVVSSRQIIRSYLASGSGVCPVMNSWSR